MEIIEYLDIFFSDVRYNTAMYFAKSNMSFLKFKK